MPIYTYLGPSAKVDCYVHEEEATAHNCCT